MKQQMRLCISVSWYLSVRLIKKFMADFDSILYLGRAWRKKEVIRFGSSGFYCKFKHTDIDVQKNNN